MNKLIYFGLFVIGIFTINELIVTLLLGTKFFDPFWITIRYVIVPATTILYLSLYVLLIIYTVFYRRNINKKRTIFSLILLITLIVISIYIYSGEFRLIEYLSHYRLYKD